MSKKPWAIVVLAAIQFLVPVISIIMNAVLSDISIWRYLQMLMREPVWEMVSFIGVPLLAGIAILAVRFWSYPVFIAAFLFSAYTNYVEWKAFPEAIPAWLLVGVYVINLLMVTYFLIPQVRRIYFDRRMRWWQTVPRYSLQFDAECERDNESALVKVENISLGGIFFSSDLKFQVGDHITFKFRLFDQDYSIRGEVVHLITEKNGFGVRFDHDPATSRHLKRLVTGLDVLRVPRRPDYSSWENRLSRLREIGRDALHFVKTGQGLIPRV